MKLCCLIEVVKGRDKVAASCPRVGAHARCLALFDMASRDETVTRCALQFLGGVTQEHRGDTVA